METAPHSAGLCDRLERSTFNFLASLINGNPKVIRVDIREMAKLIF